MVEMKAGTDKLPWWLCGICWIDGVKSMHLPLPTTDPILVDEVMADALRTSGWKDTSAGKKPPMRQVADRTLSQPAKKRKAKV